MHWFTHAWNVSTFDVQVALLLSVLFLLLAVSLTLEVHHGATMRRIEWERLFSRLSTVGADRTKLIEILKDVSTWIDDYWGVRKGPRFIWVFPDGNRDSRWNLDVKSDNLQALIKNVEQQTEPIELGIIRNYVLQFKELELHRLVDAFPSTWSNGELVRSIDESGKPTTVPHERRCIWWLEFRQQVYLALSVGCFMYAVYNIKFF